MSSQLQIDANRRNSRKSTGPRTVAGKTASSQNALGSGLYAQSQIIIGENQSDFEQLAADFQSRFHPGTPDQHALLDIAIHSEWILRRLRRAETGIWDYFIDDHDYGDGTTGLGRAFDCNDKTFARLQRRLDSLQRNFQRALKELARLQTASPQPQPGTASVNERPEPHPQPLPGTASVNERPEPQPAAHPAAQIGFVSSPLPHPAPTQPAASQSAPVPQPPTLVSARPSPPEPAARLCYTNI
jgi:hypothetical protein